MALLFANTLGLPQPTAAQPWPMQPVWIAFAYYDSSCGAANQNFRKLGWWQIDPYRTINLWNVDLQTVNRYAYFWGATANEGITWHGTGNAWLRLNPNSAFNQCAFDNTNDTQSVDFVELDFTWAQPGWDLVVSLGPNPGQVNYASQKIG